jgi:RNA polymerase sigma-70 factor, ECF subfamily
MSGAELLTATPRPIVITDAAGIAVFANAAAEARTGYSLAETIGKKPGKLWGGHMPRAFYRSLWHTVEDEGLPFVGNIRNQHKHHSLYEDRLTILPLRRRATSERFYLALQRDPRGNEGSPIALDTLQSMFAPAAWNEALRWQALVRLLGAPEASPLGEGSLMDTLYQALVQPLEIRFKARREDRDLILAAQADRSAFRTLYEKYGPLVRRYFLRHLGDEEAADDFSQETFLRAFHALGTFRVSNASYGTYLLRIAHGILLNSYRRKAFLSLDGARNESRSLVASQPTEEWLWRAPELTENEQRLLTQKYREGYSLEEIAVREGKTANAVKLALARARRKLRRAIDGGTA